MNIENVRDRIMNYVTNTFNIEHLNREMFCILLINNIIIPEVVYQSTIEMVKTILEYTVDNCRSDADKKLALLSHPEVFHASLLLSLTHSKDEYVPNMNKMKIFDIWINGIKHLKVTMEERQQFEYMYHQLNIPNIVMDADIYELNSKSTADLEAMGNEIVNKCSVLAAYLSAIKLKESINEIIENIEVTSAKESPDEYLAAVEVSYVEIGARSRKYKAISDVDEMVFTESNANEIASQIIEMNEKAMNNITPTGIPGIDKMLKYGGSESTRLYIWAAVPGGGKSVGLSNITANAFSFMKNQKIEQGSKKQAVLHLTLENKLLETNERILSNLADESMDSMVGKGHDYLADKLRDITCSENADLFVKYRSKLTLTELEMLFIDINRTHDLRFVTIDYLDLITPDASDNPFWMAIGDVARDIKILCSEFNIPIHLATQLGKSGVGETRLNNGMVAESFKKVNHADAIIMINRLPDTDEFNIALTKNRNGSIGETYVDCNWDTYKFVAPRNPGGQVKQTPPSSNWQSKSSNNKYNGPPPTSAPPSEPIAVDDDLFG